MAGGAIQGWLTALSHGRGRDHRHHCCRCGACTGRVIMGRRCQFAACVSWGSTAPCMLCSAHCSSRNARCRHVGHSRGTNAGLPDDSNWTKRRSARPATRRPGRDWVCRRWRNGTALHAVASAHRRMTPTFLSPYPRDPRCRPCILPQDYCQRDNAVLPSVCPSSRRCAPVTASQNRPSAPSPTVRAGARRAPCLAWLLIFVAERAGIAPVAVIPQYLAHRLPYRFPACALLR